MLAYMSAHLNMDIVLGVQSKLGDSRGIYGFFTFYDVLPSRS